MSTEQTAKQMLEKAYKKPLTEAEFQAISNNLSTFFALLNQQRLKQEKHNNEH